MTAGDLYRCGLDWCSSASWPWSKVALVFGVALAYWAVASWWLDRGRR